MPKYETPRNARGERICQQCHDPDKPLRPSLGTNTLLLDHDPGRGAGTPLHGRPAASGVGDVLPVR
ncbi:hypothetical protein [Streptomyces sp. NPDC087538]|uniref:hypothetical protein n=1 Tax=Streptomyces sp. NPDC087538 TaxID=3365797 RepID=UPI00381D5D54